MSDIKRKITSSSDDHINMNNNNNNNEKNQSQKKNKLNAFERMMMGSSSIHKRPSDAKKKEGFQIFCDLDGVLVDFDSGVKGLFNGRGPDEVGGRMWGRINSTKGFYRNLAWMEDGRELWNMISPLKPHILTGVSTGKECHIEKFDWCTNNLGKTTNHVHKAKRNPQDHRLVSGKMENDAINIITCWSKFKHFESGENCVLIDDRLKLKEKWVEKGGIFIHHTSTVNTLKELRSLKILD